MPTEDFITKWGIDVDKEHLERDLLRVVNEETRTLQAKILYFSKYLTRVQREAYDELFNITTQRNGEIS